MNMDWDLGSESIILLAIALLALAVASMNWNS